jgi:hypothetical protein
MLAEIAPRLFKAQQQLREERRAERVWRSWWRERDTRLEWLVGHRELQLSRAGSTRTTTAAYLDERQRKLATAREMLAAHRRLVFPERLTDAEPHRFARAA